MTNYAVLNGDKVSNIIVADSKEVAEQITGTTCIEYTDESPASIGWTYDGTTFTAPTPQYLFSIGVLSVDPDAPVVEPVVEPTE
jgi:hypothetical protein